MGISKVTLDGTSLIDLTNVTVTPEHLDKNETAHDNKGDVITGSVRPNYETELLMHTYSGAYENDEITTIGERAFNADTALTSVNCPNVTGLGAYAFSGCTNLESVLLPKINPGLLEAGRQAGAERGGHRRGDRIGIGIQELARAVVVDGAEDRRVAVVQQQLQEIRPDAPGRDVAHLAESGALRISSPLSRRGQH